MFDDMRCLGVAIRDTIVSAMSGYSLQCLSRFIFWGIIWACVIIIGLGPLVSFLCIFGKHKATAPLLFWLIGSMIWIFIWPAICSKIITRYDKIKKDKSR